MGPASYFPLKASRAVLPWLVLVFYLALFFLFLLSVHTLKNVFPPFMHLSECYSSFMTQAESYSSGPPTFTMILTSLNACRSILEIFSGEHHDLNINLIESKSLISINMCCCPMSNPVRAKTHIFVTHKPNHEYTVKVILTLLRKFQNWFFLHKSIPCSIISSWHLFSLVEKLNIKFQQTCILSSNGWWCLVVEKLLWNPGSMKEEVQKVRSEGEGPGGNV